VWIGCGGSMRAPIVANYHYDSIEFSANSVSRHACAALNNYALQQFIRAQL
jgi:hypothetical protein